MSQQTTSQPREHFGSRLGFILAAAGAAVGLGNIWGFPTQAASNGGGAFLLVYLVMILIVAFPMLVVEMAIGRHGQANPVDSMRALTSHPVGKKVGGLAGWLDWPECAKCRVGVLFDCWRLDHLFYAGGNHRPTRHGSGDGMV